MNSISHELSALGRTYLIAEMNAKILARMPQGDWFMKVIALKERDLSKDIYLSLFTSMS